MKYIKIKKYYNKFYVIFSIKKDMVFKVYFFVFY